MSFIYKKSVFVFCFLTIIYLLLVNSKAKRKGNIFGSLCIFLCSTKACYNAGSLDGGKVILAQTYNILQRTSSRTVKI